MDKAIGDLCLLGQGLIGACSGFLSGHELNNHLLKALIADQTAWEEVTFDGVARAATRVAGCDPEQSVGVVLCNRPCQAIQGVPQGSRGGVRGTGVDNRRRSGASGCLRGRPRTTARCVAEQPDLDVTEGGILGSQDPGQLRRQEAYPRCPGSRVGMHDQDSVVHACGYAMRREIVGKTMSDVGKQRFLGVELIGEAPQRWFVLQ
jgi:hypothetical protein